MVIAPVGSIEERARLAMKRAREERSKWEAYARMMTRNSETRIEFTSGTPCTDGKTIYLRVPIELGDMRPHEKDLCGQRDELFIQKCPLCAVLEDVRITMYHEVAHIAFDSFAGMSEWEKAEVLGQAVRLEANGEPDGKRITKIKKALETRRPTNFIEASIIISPWFKHLINAAEDGRVNERMAEARAGTRVMFTAHINKVFERGIERKDGSISRWTDQPKNMQAIIGVFCKVSGLKYDGWLLPEITADLNDPTITELCEKLAKVRGVGGIYRLCIPTLERLRELGYCKTPDDLEDDDPKPTGKKPKGRRTETSEEEGDDVGEGGSGESDTEEGDEGETGESTGGGGDESEEDEDGTGNGGSDDTEDDANDAENGDKESTEGDDEADSDADSDSDDDSADGDDGEAADGDEDDEGDLENPEFSGHEYTQEDLEEDGTPEDVEDGLKKFGGHDKDDATNRKEAAEIDRAIRQGEHFDSPSYAIGGVNVHTEGQGPGWDSYSRHSSPIEIPETVLAPSLMKLRVIFTENQRKGYERNLKSGRVNGKSLHRFATDDYRLFRKKNVPAKRDYFVQIGLDISGSTARTGVISLIKESAFAMTELCNRLGVKVSVHAHTGAGARGFGHDLEIYEVKSVEQPWDTQAKERLSTLRPVSANLDGHTLEFYRKIAERQQATDKVIFYFTDGAMPLENYTEELQILQREIALCKRLGITVVGVGIRNDDPKAHGLDTVRIDRIEDMPKLINDLESRLSR